MRRFGSLVAACVALSALLVWPALAADIVTVPTANQLQASEVDVALYHIRVSRSALIAPLRPLGIRYVRAQTLYIGVTDQVELDVHRYDVDKLGTETIINATVLVQAEDGERPAIVVGGRDLTRQYDRASYFISAAKTLNPPLYGPPTEPIVRLHLSVGTEDNTLFGEGRHKGLFGGVQLLLQPESPAVGAIALYDGRDLITGVTVVPEPGWPTLKGGTFGGHWWVGISHTFSIGK